jgi:hypothetical protein
LEVRLTTPTDTPVSKAIESIVEVKIGAHIFSVSYSTPIIQDGGFERLNGYIDHHAATIQVDNSRVESKIAETLLHEIIHGIEIDRRLDMSEHQVDQVAAGLMGVCADSPLVMVAILNAVSSRKVDGA